MAMTGSALVGGVLLAVIEGVGILMNRLAASNMQNSESSNHLTLSNTILLCCSVCYYGACVAMVTYCYSICDGAATTCGPP